MSPKKTKDMLYSKIGNNYILTDPETKKTYNIDPVSFLVWVQCDGQTSVDQITGVFSSDGNRDIVKAAVKGILERLEESQLIIWK